MDRAPYPKVKVAYLLAEPGAMLRPVFRIWVGEQELPAERLNVEKMNDDLMARVTVTFYANVEEIGYPSAEALFRSLPCT